MRPSHAAGPYGVRRSGPNQSRVLKARVAQLVLLILSHDRFAKRLLALFRSDVLATQTAYAAVAGAL